MNTDHDRLIQLLEDALPDAEAGALRERLRREPALRDRLDRLRGFRDTLIESRPDSFAPFFSERVLRKLAAEIAPNVFESLYELQHRLFLRVAVAGLMAACLLGAYNVMDYQHLGVSSSLLEAVFGLPSVSLMDALTYGVM